MSGLYDDLRGLAEQTLREWREDGCRGPALVLLSDLTRLLDAHTPPSEPATEGEANPESAGGCGECNRREDFDWDPIRWEQDGPVMVCQRHGALAPGWAYYDPAPVATGATTSEERCTGCGSSGADCEVTDGGCCEVCRATGGCSHDGPAPTGHESHPGHPCPEHGPLCSGEDCCCRDKHAVPPPSSDTDRDAAPSDLQDTPRVGGADRDAGLTWDERESLCIDNACDHLSLGKHSRDCDDQMRTFRAILAARARVQPEGNDRVEWGVRFPEAGDTIVRVPTRQVAESAVATGSDGEQVVRRRVGEWETVDGASTGEDD